MIKLFSAESTFGDPKMEGKKHVIWAPLRPLPIDNFQEMILNYDDGFTTHTQKEQALSMYFTEDEVRELGEYLQFHFNIDLCATETTLPMKVMMPFPVDLEQPGIRLDDRELPCGVPLTFYLSQEEGYSLPIPIVGIVYFRLLPGIPMGQTLTANGLFFFDKLFRTFGFDISRESKNHPFNTGTLLDG